MLYFHQAFGKGDEFGQEFFRARHGRRMSQPKALCHFLLDTGFLQAQSRIKVMKKAWVIAP
jgi:hypothetical protein